MNDQDYLANLVSMFDEKLPAEYIDAEISKDTLIEKCIYDAIYDWVATHDHVIDSSAYQRIASLLVDYSVEPSSELLFEHIFDEMNRMAPAGCYFGVHPGNGSLFGFFQLEEDPFELEEPFNERPI